MDSCVLLAGLDVGTTNIKALICEPDGSVIATASTPTPTHYPRSGWAHYDPHEIWSAVCDVLTDATGQLRTPARVGGIAVASVGETGYPVDSAGNPTYKGIAWFDGRSKDQAAWLAEHVGAEKVYATCRMSLQPIYGLCKLLWIRDNEPDVLARTATWLNSADYVAFRLSGKKATDHSLASRALLFDVDRRDWAYDLLDACQLPDRILAPIKPSGEAIGNVTIEASSLTGLPTSTTVSTGGHDHVCGAFGVGVIDPGTVLNSLGTAEAHFLPITKPLNRPEVAAQGYSVGGHVARDQYYAIGGLYSSGGSVDWVSRLLGSLDHATMLDQAAQVPPGSGGVHFLPHLRIANPPFGDAPSRGAFVGLTGDVDQATLYRAVLEGIAMEAKLCMDGLLSYADIDIPERIVAIGGSTRNALLMSIKSAVYGKTITVSETEEGTALGAALLAGLGCGVYNDAQDVARQVKHQTREISPDPELVERYQQVLVTYTNVYPALKALNALIDKQCR
ncbi:MAG: carbohydrate kinase [Gemmatimonadetes bacterium]|nr:carbohydrate kinase [Gemmatimonadota bacterium]